jgi:hypothetical protein
MLPDRRWPRRPSHEPCLNSTTTRQIDISPSSMLHDSNLLLVNFVADSAHAALFATLPAKRPSARETSRLEHQVQHGGRTGTAPQER